MQANNNFITRQRIYQIHICAPFQQFYEYTERNIVWERQRGNQMLKLITGIWLSENQAVDRWSCFSSSHVWSQFDCVHVSQNITSLVWISSSVTIKACECETLNVSNRLNRWWLLPLNHKSRRGTLRCCGDSNYSNEASDCWVFSSEGFRNHHLCLFRLAIGGSRDAQHPASCLASCFGRLLHPQPHTVQLVYESVQSCQDLNIERISTNPGVSATVQRAFIPRPRSSFITISC